MFPVFSFALALGLAPLPPHLGQLDDDLVQVDFSGQIVRVVPFSPEFVVVSRSGLTLPEHVQAAYNSEFLIGPYFGAFAIAKDFSYGYIAGANSRDAAAEIAKAQCSKNAPAATPNCIIYAEVLPVDFATPASGEIVLTPDAAALFVNPGKERGGFRAMAASDDGAYSLVWDYTTQAEADAAAIVDCEQYRITDIDSLSDMPCRLLPGLP